MAYPPSQEDPQGPDPLRSSSEVGVETIREVVAVEDVGVPAITGLISDGSLFGSARRPWQAY